MAKMRARRPPFTDARDGRLKRKVRQAFCGVAAGLPLDARAQQPERVRRIGVLMLFAPLH
jgi:hypothetical protein